MPKRSSSFLTLCLATCITLARAHGSPDTSTDSRPPNVIVFLVDDLGWQETSVSFHHVRTALNERYKTPNVERLAARGTKFTQAYAYAVCSPSRVSLMTGLSASRHRVTNWTLRRGVQPDHRHPRVCAPRWNLNGLSPDPTIELTVQADTLPQNLKKAGYHTIHVGKAHFGAKGTPGEDPLDLGFDVNIAGHAAGGPGSYHGEKNYSAAWRKGDRIWDVPGLDAYHGTKTNLTEALTREALRALETPLGARQPFYLYLAHYAVHAPWEEDGRFLQPYLDTGLSRHDAVLASMIESMDHSLGDVLDFLERKGIEDDTLVMFLSDNGSPKQNPRNLPLRGHKLTPYEGGIRVPLIVAWPGVTEPGTTSHHLVHIDDVFPTVLEVAGVSIDERAIDGRSFVPWLRSKSADEPSPPRALFWHYPNTYDQPPYTAMRRGRYKLIYHHADRRLELFDLEEDLGETRDLSGDRRDVLRSMARTLSEHLTETRALLPIDVRTGVVIPVPSTLLGG